MMYLIYQWARDELGQTMVGKLLNVFQYQTFRVAVACLLAFLLCVVFGRRVIRLLISLKVGQPIRSEDEVHRLHELHGGKAGTPTMGGVLFILGVAASALVTARLDNLFVWVTLYVFVGLGFVGFVDDYLKVTRKSSDGISARMKLAGQLFIALSAGAVLYFAPGTHDHISPLYVPFMKQPLWGEMPALVALPFFALVIVGCSNAVNLTDGLDGLAIGCTITVALSYAVFSYVVGNAFTAQFLLLPHHELTGELAVLCGALVGAGMGFLWFNCHPAQVFMGDTGSLALGGMLGTVAICCRQEILLILVGGVFVMEALSVILQVASFKLRGKRIFAMSPIHHHFELNGWKETQVIVRFWILSIIFALLGLATLKLR